jgi:hypothetical protein
MPRNVTRRAMGMVTALLFLAMAVHAAPLDPSIPAIQFCFSEACFNAVLAQWQPGGIERFKGHFLIDFPFLVSYGAFGYVFAQHVLRGLGWATSVKRLLTWTLPFAALMDGAENVLHLSFVYAASTLPATLYVLAGVLATIKWALIAVFAICVGCVLARKCWLTRACT